MTPHSAIPGQSPRSLPEIYGTDSYLTLIVATGALAFGSDARANSSSISSNFNGTDIAAGDWIWFNSHLTTVSQFTSPVTIYFQNQTVTFTNPTNGAAVA